MRGSAAFRTGVAPGGALAGPWVQNSLWTAARAVPSLDLRFADTKSLVDATTGSNLVTFTRASSGTFVGSDGLIQSASTDVPRFNHNPTTGESLGLLVEEARTNLLLQSEDFSDAVYTVTAGSITTNTIAAPNGTTTADTVSSTGTTVVSQSYTKAASSITYTASLFVKGTVTALSLTVDDGATANRGRCVFNLSTGTLTSTSNDGTFTGTSGSITLFANDWYRLVVTTTTNTTTTARHRFFWTGSGTSIDVWGAQLEAGAFPTSYIPTTTATVTRAADVASISGSNFSSWYRQDQGTLFANTSVSAVAPATSLQTQYAIHDGSADNRITVYKRANADTSTRLDIAAVTVSSAFINAGTFGLNNLTASAVQINNFAVSLNGLSAVVDTAGNVPSVNQMNLGSYVGATGFLNGTIRRLTYWPTRLSNATLQAVTQ